MATCGAILCATVSLMTPGSGQADSPALAPLLGNAAGLPEWDSNTDLRLDAADVATDHLPVPTPTVTPTATTTPTMTVTPTATPATRTTITGAVLRDGEPEPGVLVTVFSTGDSTTTNDEGSFTIENVRGTRGPLEVTAEKWIEGARLVAWRDKMNPVLGDVTEAGTLTLRPFPSDKMIDQTFDSGTEGWTSTGSGGFMGIKDPVFEHSGGRLTMTADNTTSLTTGSWYSPGQRLHGFSALMQTEFLVFGNTDRREDIGRLLLRQGGVFSGPGTELILRNTGAASIAPLAGEGIVYTLLREGLSVGDSVGNMAFMDNIGSKNPMAGFSLDRVRMRLVHSMSSLTGQTVLHTTTAPGTEQGWQFLPGYYSGGAGEIFDTDRTAIGEILDGRLEIAAGVSMTGYWGREMGIPLEGGRIHRLTMTVGSDFPLSNLFGGGAPFLTCLAATDNDGIMWTQFVSSFGNSGSYPAQGSNRDLRIWFLVPPELDGLPLKIVFQSDSYTMRPREGTKVFLQAVELVTFDGVD